MRLKRKSIFLSVVRILSLFVMGLVVAVVVALSQIDLESVRGNVVAVLRDATGVPVEIDGAVSWKLSLRPHIELNKVRVDNAKWAKSKYAFKADKIDVRLNLISLFRNRPTIQNVRVYDAELNIERGPDGMLSWPSKSVSAVPGAVAVTPEKYPFKDAGLGGVEIKNIKANLFGKNYEMAGFNIRLNPRAENREYVGWIKVDTDVLPFIVEMQEYNAERKVYPVRVALSTGGDALIANVALEGTSKMPIDFIVKGDLPDVAMLGRVGNWNLVGVPHMHLDVSGGMDRQKITLRKSKVVLRNTEFVIAGEYAWGKKNDVINLSLYSEDVQLDRLFPGTYDKIRKSHGRPLNVFQDVPLFGEFFVNKKIHVDVRLDNFVVYKRMNLKNTKVIADIEKAHGRIDVMSGVANGNVTIGIDADVDADGHIWLQAASRARNVQVGQLLHELDKDDLIAELPMGFDFYVRANGKDLSQVMQTITGPVHVYSEGAGYAYPAVVTYMYGTDFLTSLRHSIQDLFTTNKKHDQIKIACVALNVKLRDGAFETQNGFAIETNAINIRLAGMLDLGGEEMRLALTTVPVRGLKLSLTGNVVNSIELTGSLAEPEIKISGAAVAGKVASATGLGLLLAPFTGGIGLVAGAGVGLLAGDLLENWLADTHPCETAMARGAPSYEGDPEWMDDNLQDLTVAVLGQE